MRAGEGDDAPVRVNDAVRLVRRPALQVRVPDTAHVLLLAALADGERAAHPERQNGKGKPFACCFQHWLLLLWCFPSDEAPPGSHADLNSPRASHIIESLMH